MMLSTLILLGAITAIVYRLSRNSKSRLPLPPGPPTSWFGSELPQTYQWRTYAEWKKLYGDLIYIYVFGNPILVLNSTEVATELLERRSGNYSSRPVRTMVVELMGWDWLFSSMPYGNWWKRHRSLFHQYFHQNDTPTFYSVQVKEIRTLLRILSRTPDDFAYHIRRSSSAIVLSIAYGHQVAEEGDSYVTLADKAMQGLQTAGIWGTYLVDYIPFLKHVPAWMPGAGFQRQAREWKRLTREMVDRPYEMVKRRMADGTAVSCFVSSQLENGLQPEHTCEEEQLIKNVAAIIYAGGSDTTVSAMLSFFLAMTIHTDVQRRAQEEIDAVIGPDRLPTLEDKGSLPLIDAIVWESFRWNPAIPLGLAHYATEDDEYNGYRIPKGTTVLPNVWAILHDETKYPDPLAFNPDRFTNQENNASAGINELPHIAFGFGRRICPGRWLAYDTVWITAASMLAAYNISQPRDENGAVIELDAQYTSSMLSRPVPFKCDITSRSQRAAVLVEQTAEEA